MSLLEYIVIIIYKILFRVLIKNIDFIIVKFTKCIKKIS